MKTIALMLTLFAFNATAADVVTYFEVSTWTGDNNWSSAPSPHCACDKDENVQDCPAYFSAEDSGSVCYDEYIPAGSRGWVHAKVFKRK